jgi:cell division septum initiation protein DivIVA
MYFKLLDFIRSVPELFYIKTLLSEERAKNRVLMDEKAVLQAKIDEQQKLIATLQGQLERANSPGQREQERLKRLNYDPFENL